MYQNIYRQFTEQIVGSTEPFPAPANKGNSSSATLYSVQCRTLYFNFKTSNLIGCRSLTHPRVNGADVDLEEGVATQALPTHLTLEGQVLVVGQLLVGSAHLKEDNR